MARALYLLVVCACGRAGFDPPPDVYPSYAEVVAASQPAGYWPLVTDTADASGQGQDGTVTGQLTFEDGCARFSDGTWVTIGNAFGFDAGETFSIELWLEPDQIDITRPVITKGDFIALDSGYMLSTSTEAAQFFWFAATTNGGAGIPMLPLRWTHWVTIVDGTTVAFYLDGRLAEVSYIQQRWDPSPQPFTISSSGDGVHGGGFYEGCIAHVAVYARALTADEIVAHYASGPR